MKGLIFVGSSLDELRAFPDPVRREAGFQLDRLQRGFAPADWKPMASVGHGVCEIRLHEAGEHRVLYVAKFEEGLYVLHAFQKKTQKTAKRNIELARRRYQALLQSRTSP